MHGALCCYPHPTFSLSRAGAGCSRCSTPPSSLRSPCWPACCLRRLPCFPCEVRGSGLRAQRRDWTSGTPHGQPAGAGFLVLVMAKAETIPRDDEMRAYSKKDVDRKALKGAKIAVVGYGSQGPRTCVEPQGSGYDVVIGVRKATAGSRRRRTASRSPRRSKRSRVPRWSPCSRPTPRRPRTTRRSCRTSPRAPRCCSRTASTSTSSRSSRARTST